MITANGYSKDPSIQSEGIVITFGREMMDEQGGPKNFLSAFLEQMENENLFWMHKCKNLPTIDFDHVYIIALNRLWGRVYNGGIRRKPHNVIGWTADDRQISVDWNFITLAGPFERCPFKRELKGFQGFRYATKLF